jgi:hypothetical protein
MLGQPNQPKATPCRFAPLAPEARAQTRAAAWHQSLPLTECALLVVLGCVLLIG